jgi:GH24 family phage-related lysozyme (muramidase)
MSQLYDFISSREGVKYEVYRDSLGKLTGGIGHLILPEDNLKLGDSITQDKIDSWFDKDIQKALNKALVQCQELDIKDEEIINIFTSANYLLGDFKKVFNSTFNLIKDRKYSKAILNIATSKWMQQTPIRAGDMISAITKLV